jgi:peptidoglycan/xylan/chitin deacetylase (PgdA/CDA1 family)
VNIFSSLSTTYSARGCSIQKRQTIAKGIVFLLLLTVFPSAGAVGAEDRATAWAIKPYRALLVVERWSDPASMLVDHAKDDFQPAAALLKAWSVPFDILRLDQQHLDASYLFDRSGKVRYGVVIWLADSPSYEGQNLASLEEAAHAGTSLLVVKSRFLDPVLERLLGLKFKETYRASEPLRLAKPHFITRELAAQKMDQMDVSGDSSNRLWVGSQGAEVLISQEQHAVLTVNQPEGGVSAVWMGVPRSAQLRDSPYWRGLFFRVLVWTLGYVVQPNVDYAHRIEIEIDDWGTSDKGYLSYWRYQEPTEKSLRENLIAPLQKRGAVVAANVITGYVDRKTKRIVSPWTQKFTDAFGVEQDFASTQRGLKAAVEAGVLEIQSHGWTHMQPDLDSPPGPWWTADLAGEASDGDWYREFDDTRRGNEVPAIVQLFHMQRSLQYLKEDFGQRPLELRPGGGGWSKSLINNTGRVAAQAGFGLFHAEPSFYYYLDRDLVLDMTGISPHFTTGFDRLDALHAEMSRAHPDGPVMMVFHDRDIALQPGFVERLFTVLPPAYTALSANEYIGYLHARIRGATADGWQLTFNFDDPYCAYFDKHPSSWRLWLSDAWLEKLRTLQSVLATVDGKTLHTANAADFLHANFVIDIPAGLGEHVWRLSRAR